MKTNKEVNRIRKEMENENYETLFKNVAGIIQERAEAAGRYLMQESIWTSWRD